MSEQQKQKQRAIIEYKAIKPLVDGAAMAAGCASAAIIPIVDNPIIKAAAVGFGFSCFWFWGANNLKSQPQKSKSAKSDHIVTNWGSGKMRRFEQVAPGYVTRQPLWADILGLFRKQTEPRTMREPVAPQAKRPNTLTQYAFISSDKNGNAVQIFAKELHKFLWRAWVYRDRGKGLSERFWGYRGERNWPQWYPGPPFYQAALRLIVQAQRGLDVQLIMKLGHQQIGLKYSPQFTYDHVVTWYLEKGK